MKKVVLFLITSLVMLNAQIKIVAVEILSIPKTEHWSNALFSPSGQEIYITNSDYNGIWQYSLTTKLLKEITHDQHSGYNFVVSGDGSKIAYRRTVDGTDPVKRIQETVELELKTLRQSIIEKGNSLQTPVFMLDKSTRSEKIMKNISTVMQDRSILQVLGIEDTKIALVRNGEKILFDPLTGGQYIWPVLSPDKSKLVAVEMEHGAFVSDLEGMNIVKLGKCNAPQWTRDGKWIIGMDDKDDGRSMYSSDIIAVSVDGTKRISLTETPSRLEMFPAVSPKENKIAVTTSNGEVILLTFEEGE